MRALIVSHSAVVPVYREKFHHLARLGWEIHLVMPKAWPEGGRWIQGPACGEEQGVRLHLLSSFMKGKVGGFFLPGLPAAIDQIRPDLVYAEEEPYSLACWQVFRHCRKRGLPAAFFTWENILRGYKPPLAWIDRWVLQQAAWAVMGNQEALQVARQRGFKGEAVVLPQYGITAEKFPVADPRASGQPLVLGYMGRLLEEKGIHTLLNAAAMLTFPFTLQLIGSGPHEGSLRSLVKKLGLDERVRFIPVVPNDQVAARLAQMDMLVLPSETRPFWKEQFGRILVEAMACGKAVVGSNSGEIPHVIADAGLVFPEADAQALAAALTRLAQEPGLRQRLGQAGRARALQTFTTEAIAAKTAIFFRRMLAGTGRPAGRPASGVNRMRIALVSRGCRPGAGIELYTYELAKRLAQHHDVHVITNPRELLPCGAKVLPVRVPSKPLWHSILNFSSRAGFEAHASGFDVVHTQGSDGTWGDVVTAHSCHWAGMRASLKLHPSWVNRLRKRFSPAHRVIVNLERATFLSARRLVAVSRRVARQVRASYPGTRDIPMHVIHPGVDSAYYTPEGLAHRRDLMRSELGLAEDAVLFTLLANAPRLKGARRLIEALALTRQPNAHLLIASSQGLDPELRRLIANLQLERRVHATHVGPEVLSVYAATDVQAGLPEYESFGLAMLEAMACGRPLLMTQNAGVAEVVTHGREAWLLPGLCSSRATAEAMDRLVQDPGLRQRMAEASRQTALRHSWDRMVAALEAVYQQVAEEKKSGAR